VANNLETVKLQTRTINKMTIMPVRNENYTQPCQQMLQTNALHTIIITIFFPVKMPLTFDQKMKTAHGLWPQDTALVISGTKNE